MWNPKIKKKEFIDTDRFVVARGVCWGVRKIGKGGSKVKNLKKKLFDNMQQKLIRATLRKAVTKGHLHNMIKDFSKKPKAHVILIGEILNNFPLRLGETQGCPLYLFYLTLCCRF